MENVKRRKSYKEESVTVMYLEARIYTLANYLNNIIHGITNILLSYLTPLMYYLSWTKKIQWFHLYYGNTIL